MVETPKEELLMALCAIRYTIGRSSYIVSDGVNWARKYGVESAWVRGILIRDLQEAVERTDRGMPALGMETDSKAWRAVLAELQAVEAASSLPA